jgi:hypothetical protein
MVIRLGRPRVCSIVHGDVLEVGVPHDADGLAWPDQEWLSLLRESGEFPGDLEEPRLEHGRLRFEARDEDLQRAWSAISERAAVTNRTYAMMLAPRDRKARRGEVARRDDVAERIRDAQQLLDAQEERKGSFVKRRRTTSQYRCRACGYGIS